LMGIVLKPYIDHKLTYK